MVNGRTAPTPRCRVQAVQRRPAGQAHRSAARTAHAWPSLLASVRIRPLFRVLLPLSSKSRAPFSVIVKQAHSSLFAAFYASALWPLHSIPSLFHPVMDRHGRMRARAGSRAKFKMHRTCYMQALALGFCTRSC